MFILCTTRVITSSLSYFLTQFMLI
jgi:hypothetical protein